MFKIRTFLILTRDVQKTVKPEISEDGEPAAKKAKGQHKTETVTVKKVNVLCQLV